MSVSTFIQPDPSTQAVDQYLSVVDGDISVMSRVAAAFAPHQSAPAGMTVTVDAGPIFNGTTLTEVATQTTATIAAPATNPRIDRVVIDRVTGVASVVTGVESATPTQPAIPADAVPIARMDLTPATTAITNALITDERGFVPVGTITGGALLNVQAFRESGIYTPTPGTNSVIVEVQAGGASGGGCAAAASNQGAAGGGGGAGAFGRGRFTSGFAGVPVTVGAGRPANAAGVAGSAGNPSSFGDFLVCPGGTAGLLGDAVVPVSISGGLSNVAGPVVGGNLVSASGEGGKKGMVYRTNSVLGGRGGNSVSGANSSGVPGGNGSGSLTATTGGGGGGGSTPGGGPARAGGAGAGGFVNVYEYA